jgi:quinol monooxygenase YgiN
MPKYLFQGKLIAKPGLLDQLTEIMLQASKMILVKAKGCQLYAVGQSEQEDNTVYITEIWDSKQDHDLSLSVAGVKELISQAIPLLLEMPTKGQEINLLN